ncbi:MULTISPECIES: hypothetical protein [Methylomonas]|uniref:Uncharacterized protein n=2 Tax=Methylomonas TaxID=416 RepID=A0A126T8P9_9GAMM|nr:MULTISPECIES: hypothetical protein [Methylomonas]AMK78442.1 hypothetical protein JT25_018420 [Methylomonas denitrificans]OAI04144.1 hypothetical protein A1342_06345 [Methylomonas methanica]TCV87528.1 hypothetical protein EDE11_10229 [Methylomonas methanica]
MSNDRQLGLDELMIVNPGCPGVQSLFLGEDGVLYQLQDLAAAEDASGAGQFFLGDDGQLYQTGDAEISGLADVGDVTAATDAQAPGRYFLGEDGQLYERIS